MSGLVLQAGVSRTVGREHDGARSQARARPIGHIGTTARRGAGSEHAAERPVLTVGQVFELAHLVGVVPSGMYAGSPVAVTGCATGRTVRCARCLERAIRALAEEALWLMGASR